MRKCKSKKVKDLVHTFKDTKSQPLQLPFPMTARWRSWICIWYLHTVLSFSNLSFASSTFQSWVRVYQEENYANYTRMENDIKHASTMVHTHLMFTFNVKNQIYDNFYSKTSFYSVSRPFALTY